jgi:hypothetical protein
MYAFGSVGGAAEDGCDVVGVSRRDVVRLKARRGLCWMRVQRGAGCMRLHVCRRRGRARRRRDMVKMGELSFVLYGRGSVVSG